MHNYEDRVYADVAGRNRSGFSLLELSVVLLLVGLFAGGALTMFGAADRQQCYTQTKAQMNEIRDAVERFAMSNDRFPLPARRFVGVESPHYGREVDPTNTALIDSELESFTNPAGTLPVGKKTTFGALPTSTLGLGSQAAVDCWGNKFTYVVTRELTVPKDAAGNNPFLANADGAFDIFTQAGAATPFLKGAGYAIISHGADQLGAVKDNWSDPAATTLATRKWCTADAAARNKTENCDANNNVLVSTSFNDGKDAAANFYDDMIAYKGKPWRATQKTCRCGPAGPHDLFTTGPDLSLFTVNPTCN